MYEIMYSFFVLASSKQRASLRKSISEEKNRIKKYVSEYKKVVVESNMQIPVVTEEEVMLAQFPWSQLSGIIV